MAYGKIKADAIVYDNSGTDVEVSTADITGKANLASPAFTGTPTAPTAAEGTNTTQLATTAFVEAAAGNKLIEEGSTYRVQILAIGGGGAGAYTDSGYNGGGGGAGGMAYHDGVMVTDGNNYTVTIGGGANGPTSDSQMGRINSSHAPNGGDTTVSGTGVYILCYGGGGGAGYNNAYLEGATGGCGGGGEGYSYSYHTSSHARQSTGGTAAFGTQGGFGAVNQGDVAGFGSYNAGGGGGVGGAPEYHSANGGHGSSGFHEWLAATSQGVVTSSIRYIGGGGGGGTSHASGSGGSTGGRGGAGNGGNNSGSSGGDASDGTGSGGGGRGRWDTGSGRGGNGGDGLVIFRYQDNKGQKGSGGTVVQSGGYYYHTFTSGGTFTA